MVRALGVGKVPMTPSRHGAITRSGPVTKNIGAATNGNFRRARHSCGKLKGSPLCYFLLSFIHHVSLR